MKKRENKKLTSISIEPSFKEKLEKYFEEELGLSWPAGVRFVLRDYYNNHAKIGEKN